MEPLDTITRELEGVIQSALDEIADCIRGAEIIHSFKYTDPHGVPARAIVAVFREPPKVVAVCVTWRVRKDEGVKSDLRLRISTAILRSRIPHRLAEVFEITTGRRVVFAHYTFERTWVVWDGERWYEVMDIDGEVHVTETDAKSALEDLWVSVYCPSPYASVL